MRGGSTILKKLVNSYNNNDFDFDNIYYLGKKITFLNGVKDMLKNAYNNVRDENVRYNILEFRNMMDDQLRYLRKNPSLKAQKAGDVIAGAIKRKSTKQFEPAPAPLPSPAQTPYDNVNRIKRFLKDKLILNKFSLQNRINRYNVIRKALNELKPDDCLKKKGEGYTIRNIVNLEKKIGTKSKIGTIYLTSVPNNLGSFPIASKVMIDSPENILETTLMEKITETIILKGYSKHFVIMYKDTLCSKEKSPSKIKLVNYNELCNGDLKTLTNNIDLLSNEELIFNLSFQCFISISTYHHMLNYTHQDCHFGNFLYQLNNETGYYHYIYKVNSNKFEFYLKSCPYNITIFDYGLSEEIEDLLPAGILTHTTEISNDYDRIINAFINKKSGGWVVHKDLPPKQINDKMLKIQEEINNASTKANRKQKVSIFKISLFIKIIELFQTYAPADMLLNDRPTNVINKQPFYISM